MSADSKLYKAAQASDLVTAAIEALEKANVTEISAALSSWSEGACRTLEAALALLDQAPKGETPSKSQDANAAVTTQSAERILAKDVLTAATEALEKASVTEISAALSSWSEGACRTLEAALAMLNQATSLAASPSSAVSKETAMEDRSAVVGARRAERIVAKEEGSKQALLKDLAESKKREAQNAEDRTKRIDAARATRREAQAASKIAAAERARQNWLLAKRREERIAAKERERREKELGRISAIKRCGDKFKYLNAPQATVDPAMSSAPSDPHAALQEQIDRAQCAAGWPPVTTAAKETKAMDFKVGDRVYRITGSWAGTVLQIGDAGQIRVKWDTDCNEDWVAAIKINYLNAPQATVDPANS